MTKTWIRNGVLTGTTVLFAGWAYANSFGPIPNVTGAPADGSQTCNQSGCHRGNPLNAPGGSITLSGVPASYVPGSLYSIGVQVKRTGQRRWGFEATAMLADGSRGGQINVMDSNSTQVLDTGNDNPGPTTPQYIEHTVDGTAMGQRDVGPVWTFQWVAPPAGSGTVTFYAAGNAANGDGTNGGDYIYTTSVASSEGSDQPAVVYGDLNGDGKVNVVDATLALQFAVGLKTPTAAQQIAGDVAPKIGTGPRAGQPFGDGVINISDAIRILRRATGLEPDPFP